MTQRERKENPAIGNNTPVRFSIFYVEQRTTQRPTKNNSAKQINNGSSGQKKKTLHFQRSK